MRKLMLLGLALPALFFSSCFNEKSPSGAKPPVGSDEQTQVNFQLQLPAGYSLNEASVQENELSSVYILAFRVDDSDPGNIREYYDYTAKASNITDTGSDTRYKQFTVTVYKKEYKQRFVVIGNAESEVRSLDTSQANILKEDLLDKLECTNTSTWCATDSDFRCLPMWGESERVSINDNNNQVGTVKLVRMVSRIDVNLSDAAAANFELSSIHLYNYHPLGRVTPQRDNLIWDESNNKAKAVSMPLSGATKTRGPHEIMAKDISGEKYLPSVYTFEACSTPLDNPSQATAVVIGGKFGDSGKTSYYRVDFIDRDKANQAIEFGHLLRNHIYIINITGVTGEGHGTADDAFDALSVNMDVDILEWEQGEITDVVFDNQYMLGVSQSEFSVGKKAGKYELLVTTDVPDGWVLVPEDGYDWIYDFSGSFQQVNRKEPLSFKVSDNNTGSIRTGYFWIKAGRLSIRIKVEQGIADPNYLNIHDTQGNALSELLFCSYKVNESLTEKRYQVDWSPTDENCMVSVVKTGSVAFNPAAGQDPSTDPVISGGTKIYAIKPAPVQSSEVDALTGNPFLEKKSQVNYIAGSGSDMSARSITLRNVFCNLLHYEDDSYDMDGNEKSFTIRTNCQWSAEVISGEKKLITEIKTLQGAKSEAGTTFTFVIADDDVAGLGNCSATIRFTYKGEDGGVAYKDVVINGVGLKPAKSVEGANSYILEKSGEGIKIPVRWANDAVNPSRISSSEKLYAKLLWTDSPAGIGSSAVVSRYSLSGDGAGAILEVYPGSSAGNAVIAVYGQDDQVRWSWHIWVPDYDIASTTKTSEGFEWMTINLGAKNNTPGSTGSYGLLYQWGRKDPFPSINSMTSSTPQAIKIYNESGEVFTDIDDVTAANNLENSIKYPMRFYKGNENGDWYGKSSSNYKLWDTSKQHEDPCPLGWKTPGTQAPWGWYVTGTWNSTNKGFTTSTLGYLPAAGSIDSNTGKYINNDTGYIWAAYGGSSSGVTISYRTKVYSGSSLDNGTASRAEGLSIRCVRDK